MRFKVGDKVRVKTDLITNREYNDGCMCQKEMTALRGKVVTIRGFNSDHTRYLVLEDLGGWCWTDEMFEPVGFNKNLLTDGVIVKCRNNDLYIMLGERLIGPTGWLRVSDYDNDLKIRYSDPEWDIVTIYRPDKPYNIESLFDVGYLQLIAERPEEVKEMTLAEVCKELGYNVKIVKEV